MCLCKAVDPMSQVPLIVSVHISVRIVNCIHLAVDTNSNIWVIYKINRFFFCEDKDEEEETDENVNFFNI